MVVKCQRYVCRIAVVFAVLIAWIILGSIVTAKMGLSDKLAMSCLVSIIVLLVIFVGLWPLVGKLFVVTVTINLHEAEVEILAQEKRVVIAKEDISEVGIKEVSAFGTRHAILSIRYQKDKYYHLHSVDLKQMERKECDLWKACETILSWEKACKVD